jgi:hypothetical protein
MLPAPTVPGLRNMNLANGIEDHAVCKSVWSKLHGTFFHYETVELEDFKILLFEHKCFDKGIDANDEWR